MTRSGSHHSGRRCGRRSVRRSARRSVLPRALLVGLLGAAVFRGAAADTLLLEPSEDNTLYERNPTFSNGAGDHVFTGTDNSGFVDRALLRFDIAGSIAPGSIIQGVTLQLYMSRTVDGGSRATNLHVLLADWGEGFADANGEEGGGAPAYGGDATWLHREYPDLSWVDPGGDFSPAMSASTQVSGIGFYTWSTAQMAVDVQAWLDSPSSNHGWIVRGQETGGQTSKRFDSRSVSNLGQRPRLVIDYTPSGVVAGACCLPDESCVILEPGVCAAQGGTYRGDGTTCATDPCLGVPITVVIEPSRDNTMYDEGPGTLSNGAGEFFFAGMMDTFAKRRALIGFDFTPHIPAGAVISSATLTLRKTFGGSSAHDAYLHRLEKDWGEGASDAPGDEDAGAPAEAGDATWLHNLYPNEFWTNPGGDYDSVASASAYVAFEAFWSWSSPGMVDDIQSWVDDPGQNFGWILIGKETGDIITRKRYVSREGADVQYRPQLEVVFFVPPDPPNAGLPPVPVPPENPITEEKRVLGKVLFWEEQLSWNDSMACGTCHRPADGGIDPRFAVHPGFDLAFGSDDDILGSPGVRRADSLGSYYTDPVFGDDVQVTGRASQNYFGGLWGPKNFWDGRAEGTFLDPLTDEVAIENGGALENQALVPILSDVEMAFEQRSWADVTSKLAAATPLVLATDLPTDVQDALTTSPTYPDLFAAAFGDGAITPTRIAFAIATYERTLVADDTPWDRFVDGDGTALTPAQVAGADFVQNGACSACHGGPLFTSNSFRNIGLRPPEEDNGREGVTGDPNHRGRFKVPTLRNVGLRNRLMHTGQITDVADALRFYSMIGHTHYTENQDSTVVGGIPMTAQQRSEIEDFLVNGLTDPRVAGEAFPFDRPALSTEDPVGVEPPTASGTRLVASARPNPFREAVEISFALRAPGDVELSIYNAAGQLVSRRRVAGTAGRNSVRWDGRSAHGSAVAGGIYFARIEAPEGSAVGRLIRIQ